MDRGEREVNAVGTIIIDPEDLLKRIDKLSSDTETFKSTVIIVGGIAIGVICILIICFIYLYILLMRTQNKFEQKLIESDPLRRYTTIATPDQKLAAPTPIPNRFKNTSGQSTPVSSLVSTPTSSRSNQFPQLQQQNSNMPRPNQLSLPAPKTPSRLLNNLDSPMHYDGKSPSTFTHFDFPPQANRALQREISEVSRAGPRTPRFY